MNEKLFFGITGKEMKKFLILTLSLVLIVGFLGCQRSGNNRPSNNNNIQSNDGQITIGAVCQKL